MSHSLLSLRSQALYRMSVPFSNTNLRIPRGFGNLLEGLAKEVLRDQPEDIPAFAARYFSGLLKAREGDFPFLQAFNIC